MKVLKISRWLVIGLIILTVVIMVLALKTLNKPQDAPPPIEIILPEGEPN